jgi:hypothetical protein
MQDEKKLDSETALNGTPHRCQCLIARTDPMLKNKYILSCCICLLLVVAYVVVTPPSAYKFKFYPYEMFLLHQADKGDVDAMNKLFLYYLSHFDSEEVLSHAEVWARRSAEAGSSVGSNNVEVIRSIRESKK